MLNLMRFFCCFFKLMLLDSIINFVFIKTININNMIIDRVIIMNSFTINHMI